MPGAPHGPSGGRGGLVALPVEYVGADAVGDPGRGCLDRIARQMRIARGRVDLVVTEQLADHRQRFSERQRPARKRVAHIVDPRSAALSVRGFTQTNDLSDLGEVPFSGLNACPLAVLDLKERTAAGMGHNMITELPISLQLRDDAPGDRYRAALPVLGMPDGKDGLLGVDILVIEPECFADPQALPLLTFVVKPTASGRLRCRENSVVS